MQKYTRQIKSSIGGALWGQNGFNPSSLSPDVWFDPANNVITDGAAKFVSTLGQRLGNATLSQVRPISSFTIGGWFKFDTGPGIEQVMIGKYTATGSFNGDFGLRRGPGVSGVTSFLLFNQGVAISNLSSSIILSLGVWYFISAGYDASKNDSWIQIDDNPRETTKPAFTPTYTSPDACFAIGTRSQASTIEPLDGVADSCFAATGTSLTEDECIKLYNEGMGFTGASFAVAYPLIWSKLTNWWDLDERIGVRYDSIGSANLSPYSNPIIDLTTQNGGFETAGTGGFASWSETFSGTSTVNRDTVVFDSGVASCRLDIDGSNSSAAVTQTILTLNTGYSARFRAKASFGTPTILVGDINALSGPALTTSFATYNVSFTATNVDFRVKNGTAPSNSLWIDGLVLTPDIAPAIGIVSGSASDGDPVSGWTAIDGSNLAIQSTLAAKPTWRASALGGSPCMEFNGINSFLDILGSLASLTNNIAEFSIIIACSSVVAGNISAVVFATGAGAGRVDLGRSSTSERIFGRRLDADSGVSVNSPSQAYSINTPTVLSARFNYQTTTVKVMQNDVLGPNTTTFQTAGNTSPTNSTFARIGSANSATFWNGLIGDIFLFKRYLTDTENTNLQRYIGRKMGIIIP